MIEKLNQAEMEYLKGGVSVEEYCDTMLELAHGEYAQNEWTAEEWHSWAYAYAKYC